MRSRSVIVFDTEFTAWEGSLERNWRNPGEHREIVQIGAVRADAEFREIDTLNLFVRPIRNPILSEYFCKLSGISQEKIDKCGVPFGSAWREFVSFIDGESTHIYSNGGDDIVIAENLRLNNIVFDLRKIQFRDVQPYLKLLTGRNDFVASGEVSRHFGIRQVAQTHDALADARSILGALRLAHARGFAPTSDPVSGDVARAQRDVKAIARTNKE